MACPKKSDSRHPLPMWVLWTRGRQEVARWTAGGRWTDRMPGDVRRNLRWYWFDGVLAQASEAIVLAFLPLYVLALGGSRGHIGWMSSFASLSAALLLLPGAAIAERWGRDKWLCLLSGGGAARITVLLLALAPRAGSGPAVLAAAIALAVARNAFTNLSIPAWMSLTAEVVPMAWRGRYFSSRNIAMGVAGLTVTLVVGGLITRIGGTAGYQWAMGLAFALGVGSTLSFARLDVPVPAIPPLVRRDSFPAVLEHVRRHPGFLAFCATAVIWSFSLNTAGPFFSVYLVENLGASAAVVGATSAIQALAGLPAYRLFGGIVDRWGPRRVMLVTGLLIPMLPWAWLWVRSPWQVAPISLAGGVLWAGYNLASFNFVLGLTPDDHRPRYSAFYQTAVTLALAGGAALGGLIATHWGYRALFTLSGAGRLVAALLFVCLVRPTGDLPSTEREPSMAEG